MKIIPIIFASILLIGSARARIHENFQECVTRYGNAIKELPSKAPAEKTVLFQKGGYDVVAYFIKDRVEQLIIRHSDGSDFEYEAITSLVNANAETSKFGPATKGDKKNFSFTREDKRVVATWVDSERLILIESSEFRSAGKALKDKKESTDGF